MQTQDRVTRIQAKWLTDAHKQIPTRFMPIVMAGLSLEDALFKGHCNAGQNKAGEMVIRPVHGAN